jgi:hypothetical protein
MSITNLVGVGDAHQFQKRITELNEHALELVRIEGDKDPVMTAVRMNMPVDAVMALCRAQRNVITEIARSAGCVIDVGAVIAGCEAYEQYVRSAEQPNTLVVLGTLHQLGVLSRLHRKKTGGLGYHQS